jgi:hypothetical protein
LFFGKGILPRFVPWKMYSFKAYSLEKVLEVISLPLSPPSGEVKISQGR